MNNLHLVCLSKVDLKAILWLVLFTWGHQISSQSLNAIFQTTKPAILFVGNSLTYTNDLPSLVKKYAATQGVDIGVEILALPNYALVDHLADGKLQEKISSKTYLWVVVQQGPSSQAEGKQLLWEALESIQQLCRQFKTKLVVFMVWPAYEIYHTFDGVIKNYTQAATEFNAILCPVGKIWKENIDSTGDLSWYGSDLFHPSMKGSEMAAEIIFKSIFTAKEK